MLKQNLIKKFEKIVNKDTIYSELKATWEKLGAQIEENQKAIEEIEDLQCKLQGLDATLSDRNSSYDRMRFSLEELLEELT